MAGAEEDLYKYEQQQNVLWRRFLTFFNAKSILSCNYTHNVKSLFIYIFVTKFSVWKKMTLSSDTDQSRYRVWDYPIKEQYTHIFKVTSIS